MNRAEAPPLRDRAVPQYVRRERSFGRALEQPLRHDLDSGEHERCDVALFAAAQAAGAVHMKIAHAAVILRPRQRNEEQQRIHLLVVPMRREKAKGVGRTVDPQIVAVDCEEWVGIDEVSRPNESAAGFQQEVTLVGNADVETMLAAREMRFHGVGQLVDVDHHFLHARSTQPVENVVEKRLAGDFDDRLGARSGKRPHPLPEAGGHDHRRTRDFAGNLGAQSERAARLAHAARFQG
jgi:hypothetical protein